MNAIRRIPPPGPLFDRPSCPSGAPIDEAMIAHAEARLGVRLPARYVEVLRECNGGALRRTRFPMREPTGWADDHVAMRELAGIGPEAVERSIYMVAEWKYPAPSVVLDSEGHDAFLLDYRARRDEPPVVYVEQRADGDGFRLWELAPSFDAFVAALTYDAHVHTVGLAGTNLAPRDVVERLGGARATATLLDGVEAELPDVPGRSEPRARLSVDTNLYPDESGWHLEEHLDCELVARLDVADAELDAFLERVARRVGCEVVLVERANVPPRPW